MRARRPCPTRPACMGVVAVAEAVALVARPGGTWRRPHPSCMARSRPCGGWRRRGAGLLAGARRSASTRARQSRCASRTHKPVRPGLFSGPLVLTAFECGARVRAPRAGRSRLRTLKPDLGQAAWSELLFGSMLVPRRPPAQGQCLRHAGGWAHRLALASGHRRGARSGAVAVKLIYSVECAIARAAHGDLSSGPP